VAFQAPWRLRRDEARAAALRLKHDPVMNDPKISARDKAYRRERLNSPMIAREAEAQWTDAEAVIRQAVASSSDDDISMFVSEWKKFPKGA
jgi:hypothetical protein